MVVFRLTLYLFYCKKSPGRKDDEFPTPCSAAVSYGHEDCLLLLLESKADIHAKIDVRFLFINTINITYKLIEV